MGGSWLTAGPAPAASRGPSPFQAGDNVLISQDEKQIGFQPCRDQVVKGHSFLNFIAVPFDK